MHHFFAFFSHIVYTVSLLIFFALPGMAHTDLHCFANDTDQARCSDNQGASTVFRGEDSLKREDIQRIRFKNSLLLILSTDRLFEVAKSVLREDSESVLQDVLQVVKQYQPLYLAIGAHTDHVGSETFNRRLSRERADQIAAYLWRYGIDRQRMRIAPVGFEQPIADVSRPSGMALNRRIELCLAKTAQAGCLTYMDQ